MKRMKPQLVVSDWNGTLITDNDDAEVNRQIGLDELDHCLYRPWLWPRVASLGLTARKLKRMVADYSEHPGDDTGFLIGMYDLFNGNVVRGIHLGRIRESVGAYAAGAVARLDPAFDELLSVRQSGQDAVVMTSAFDLGVHAVMQRKTGSGPKEMVLPVSGSFFEVGKSLFGVKGAIRLENYDDAHRRRKLDDMARMYEISVDKIALMDDRDYGSCMADVGVIVVPPQASDAYRQHMMLKYMGRVRTPGRAKGDVYKALTMA